MQKLVNKINDIQSDIQKVKDTELKQHLKIELATLQQMAQHQIKREFSYFKHITLTITGATGVILFWRGVYELTSRNVFLRDPYFSLFTGIIILAFTGLLSRQFINVPTKTTRPIYNE